MIKMGRVMKNKNFILSLALILLALLFYFVANFQRIAIPGAIFDILEQELSVGTSQITAFGAIFMYVYALTQLINGVLIDRFGGYRVMLVGSIIMTIGCIIFPISSNIFILYFARGLLGLGGSMFYLSLIKELGNLFSDKNFGLALSIMLFIGYAGGIAANAPFVYALKYISWREFLLIIAAIVVVAVVLYLLILPKLELKPINKQVKIRTLPFRLVLHKKHNRNLFTFACCNFGISYVIQTVIGKKFLEDFCLLSPVRSAFILSIMAIIAAIFNIVNATVCSLLHNHRVVFLKFASIVTFLSLLVLCILIYFDIKTIGIAFIFCILSGNASLSSILVPVLHMTNRKMTSTTAVSIMNFSFFMMVGFLGSITGAVLTVFEPIRKGNILVYDNKSYLLLFGIFLIISLYEMSKAAKLSNKY